MPSRHSAGAPQRTQRGISVPEVLVAAALLAIAVLCISPMLSFGFKSSHLNKERAAAAQAGKRLVEEIRHAGFAAALSIVNPATTSAVRIDDLQGNKIYITGTGKIATAPGSNTKPLQVQRLYYFDDKGSAHPADDTIQVTVKITWPGSSESRVTMGTTLARSVVE